MNELWIQFRESLPDQSELLLSCVGAFVVIVLLSIIYMVMVRGLSALRKTERLSLHSYLVLRRIAYWALCVSGLLLVLQQFGLMENAWTTLTAMLAMVAVGFVAVWSVLSNMLCSIMLMASRPFDVGDTVEIPAENLRGQVADFNLIYTTLRDEDGSFLQVPNNVFFQKTIRRRIGAATMPLERQLDLPEANE